MNLIEQVARLKERQATEASATYQTTSDEFRYECDMLNAAPTMLDVLGGFRPGDSEVLTGLLLANAPYGNPAREVLRRMRAMASKMEEQ